MFKIDNGLSSDFALGENFESYPGMIHGGIISTILDEVMGNVPVVLESLLCLTVSLRVRFIAPLNTAVGYRCVARIVERPTDSTDVFKIEGSICRADSRDELVAASGHYRPFRKVEGFAPADGAIAAKSTFLLPTPETATPAR